LLKIMNLTLLALLGVVSAADLKRQRKMDSVRLGNDGFLVIGE